MARSLSNYDGVSVPDTSDAQPTAAGLISGAVGGNDLAAALDDHDHTTGRGVPIPTAGLAIDEDLTFGGFAATDLELVDFATDILDAALVPRSIAFVSGDLRWRKGDGSLVSPASSTGLAALDARVAVLEGQTLDTRLDVLEALDIGNRLDGLEAARTAPISLMNPRTVSGTFTVNAAGTITASSLYEAWVAVNGVCVGCIINEFYANVETAGSTITVYLMDGSTVVATLARAVAGSGTLSATALGHTVVTTSCLYLRLVQSTSTVNPTLVSAVRINITPA